MLGRSFHPAWVIAPVAITVLADWTENLVQIGQFRRYVADNEATLQASWTHIASTATILKLLFYSGSSVFLLGLVVVIVVRALRSA